MKIVLINIMFYFILIISCVNNKVISLSESSIWKSDTIACLGERRTIYCQILKQSTKFFGKTEKEIIQDLGKPNILKYTLDSCKKYYYFVEKGVQCLYSQKSKYNSMDVEVLYILFNKKNKVIDIRGMKP